MRTIAKPDQYSVRAIPRRDSKTWTWHIFKAGRNPRAGKSLPVQRANRKYRSQEEAQAAGETALAEFFAALKAIETKRS